jgi:hypothetical protein
MGMFILLLEIFYRIFDDVISYPTRPLVFFNYFSGGNEWSILSDTSIISHIVLSVIIILTVIFLFLLFWVLKWDTDLPVALGQVIGTITFGIDGLWELAQLTLTSLYGKPNILYPLSHTGFVALSFLPFLMEYTYYNFWHIFLRESDDDWTPFSFPYRNYFALVICLYSRLCLTSPEVQKVFGLPMLFNIMSVIAFAFAISPSKVLKWLLLRVGSLKKAFKTLLSFVYVFFVHVWPKIVAFTRRILSSPFFIFIHRWLLHPLWSLITPFGVPTALIVLSWNIFVSVKVDTLTVFKLNEVSLLISQIFCIYSCVVSSLLLLIGGIGWKPSSISQVKAFGLFVRICSLPAILIQSLMNFLVPTFYHVVLYVCSPICSIFLSSFCASPFVTILITIALGISWLTLPRDLFPLFFTSDLSNMILSVLTSLRLISDTVFLTAFVAFVQISTFHVCSYSFLSPAILSSSFTSLPVQELSHLAESMASPRRCARCWYGPVDHTGCNNLSSHHREGLISNACPRCGWFSSSLNDWPDWDSTGQSERNSEGNSVIIRRAFEDCVLLIRASAKATVIPLALMTIMTYFLPNSPSSGALLALSYLVPWIMENRKVWNVTFQSQHDNHLAPRLQSNDIGYPTYRLLSGGRDRHQRQYQRGLNNARYDEGLEAEPPIQPVNDDCGGHREVPARMVSGGETISTLLAEAAPTRIFADTGCSICLDNWTQTALDILTNSAPSDAARKLQTIDPACIALRCGHLLHLSCADEVLQSEVGRHHRCPLCRQPLTLAGDISAGLFM